MGVVNGIEISCIPASCVRDGVEDKHTQISKIRDLNGLIAALFARLLTFIVVIGRMDELERLFSSLGEYLLNILGPITIISKDPYLSITPNY